jgi:hypothetical protein
MVLNGWWTLTQNITGKVTDEKQRTPNIGLAKAGLTKVIEHYNDRFLSTMLLTRNPRQTASAINQNILVALLELAPGL